jgi:hypothetical protein
MYWKAVNFGKEQGQLMWYGSFRIPQLERVGNEEGKAEVMR